MKIVVLGSQGSGKSTQAKLLAQKLKIPVIEMGQIFRDKSKGNDIEAGQVRQALESGNLVPDQIAIKTLQKRLARSDCKNGYVLDGYPRNYAQIEGLPTDIDKVIVIRVSDQEGIKRLIQRLRKDDSLDIITQRLAIYHKETEPLLTYFRNKGILVEIDGEKSSEQVHQEIVEKLKI